MDKYIAPSRYSDVFNCPYCTVPAQQKWTERGSINSNLEREYDEYNDALIKEAAFSADRRFSTSLCAVCGKEAVWVGTFLVYPLTSLAPHPVEDMPEDVKYDYSEARTIVNLSPRAAAALLRLSVETLVDHLNAKGKNLNEKIGYLVKNRLPKEIQQALDSVRVIGNNAVHPGQIDLRDDIATATKLFELVNFIVKNRITEPKEVKSFFEEKIPKNQKEAIKKRNGK